MLLEPCRFLVFIFLSSAQCCLEEHGDTSAIHFYLPSTFVIHPLHRTGVFLWYNMYPFMCLSLYVWWIPILKKRRRRRKTSTLTFPVLPASLMNVQPFKITNACWKTHESGKKNKKNCYLLYTVQCTLFIAFSYCRNLPDTIYEVLLFVWVVVLWFPTQVCCSYKRLFTSDNVVSTVAWTTSV